MSDIQVVEIRLLPPGRDLKAFASVRVGEWTFHDFRITQESGHRAAVLMPQVSWRDKGGVLRFRSLLSIPGDLRQRIETAILSAWEEKKREVPQR